MNDWAVVVLIICLSPFLMVLGVLILLIIAFLLSKTLDLIHDIFMITYNEIKRCYRWIKDRYDLNKMYKESVEVH